MDGAGFRGCCGSIITLVGLGILLACTIYGIATYGLGVGLVAGVLIGIFLFSFVGSIFMSGGHLCTGIVPAFFAILLIFGVPLGISLFEAMVIDNGKYIPEQTSYHDSAGNMYVDYAETPGHEVSKSFGMKVFECEGDCFSGFWKVIFKIPATFIPECGYARTFAFWAIVIFIAGIIYGIAGGKNGG